MKQLVLFVGIMLVLGACTEQKKRPKVIKKPSPFQLFLEDLTVLDTVQRRNSDEISIIYEEGISLSLIPTGTVQTTIISLHQTDFPTSFSYAKTWMTSDKIIGKFLHHVFPDSIPTTTWEQLIHHETDEATIVVNTNKAGEVNALFMDINPNRKQFTLVISSDGKSAEIRWTFEK